MPAARQAGFLRCRGRALDERRIQTCKSACLPTAGPLAGQERVSRNVEGCDPFRPAESGPAEHGEFKKPLHEIFKLWRAYRPIESSRPLAGLPLDALQMRPPRYAGLVGGTQPELVPRELDQFSDEPFAKFAMLLTNSSTWARSHAISGAE